LFVGGDHRGTDRKQDRHHKGVEQIHHDISPMGGFAAGTRRAVTLKPTHTIAAEQKA
jgi:hypothetical protein